MSFYLKLILIIFGLAYLILPTDIIPDWMVPYLGWLDDGALIALIIYMIRTGRFPFFNADSHKTSDEKSSGGSFSEQTRAQKNQDTEKKYERKPPNEKKPAHEILGVDENASFEEIQKAYKTAIKTYHPDKVSHMGKEFSDLAQKKFVEIQKAYETLSRPFTS